MHRGGTVLLSILASCVLTSGAWAQEGEAPSSLLGPGGDYVIGVEDTLDLSVWGHTELDKQVTVRPDGKISFPLVQDIQAAGMTPVQLKQALTASLAEFVKDPNVTVNVNTINSFKVFVIGEVGSQGVFLLKSRTRLLQLIAMAGGLTTYADKSKIILVRDEKGREVRIPIDYRKILSGEQPDLNMYLKPGDTILVN